MALRNKVKSLNLSKPAVSLLIADILFHSWIKNHSITIFLFLQVWPLPLIATWTWMWPRFSYDLEFPMTLIIKAIVFVINGQAVRNSGNRTLPGPGQVFRFSEDCGIQSFFSLKHVNHCDVHMYNVLCLKPGTKYLFQF